MGILISRILGQILVERTHLGRDGEHFRVAVRLVDGAGILV